MKKIIALILSLMLAVSMLSACEINVNIETETEEASAETDAEAEIEPAAEEESEAEEPEAEAEAVTIRLAGLKGPTSMGMVKLLDDAENGLTENTYEFTMAGSADEITPLLIKGDLDIAALPVNLGAVLYAKTEGGLQFAAINTLGVIYICEKGGETVTDIESLKGRTIYATGKGSTPEYALTYLLEQHGLDIETDVTMEWKSEPTEVVALMQNEENAVAMLPQPYVTVASGQVEGLHIALNLTEEWNALDNGSEFITAGILVRKAFAEEHPEAVASFLEEYAASTAYANENAADAAALIEKYGIVKAPIAEKALPYCNIVCITGNEMKTKTEGYLQVLFDLNPQAVGGALPGEDFYLIID
ncbi:MAG: ABC transporter substrate-binding protein [Lachnospiraceae bacterium]|nr:ABC transporter substrate-binding protein [Lachnospiraceae bacterium]